MEYLWCLISLFIGAIAMHILNHKRRPDGVLRIDHTNPEKDLYRFEIDNLDNLSARNRIVLRVDNDAKLSRD